MTCPVCGGKVTVRDTHVVHDEIYRRRMCTVCRHVYYTVEFEVEDPQQVLDTIHQSDRHKKQLEYNREYYRTKRKYMKKEK